MGVIVANYIELSNDKNKTVIDDSYNVPFLLSKFKVKVDSPVNYGEGMTVTDLYPSGSYIYHHNLFEGSIDDINNKWGLGMNIPSSATSSQVTGLVRGMIGRFIVAYRPITLEAAIIPEVTSFNNGDGTWRLVLQVFSDVINAEAEIAIYYTGPASIKSSLGLQVLKEDGSVHFDLFRPPLCVLGVLNGTVNTSQHIGGVYDFSIPSDVLPEHCFLTYKSGAPFYSAYKIGARGVSYAQTHYKNIISFPNSTTLRVTSQRAKTVNNTNSPYGYGGFYELVVHCPFPIGDYRSPP